MSKNNQRKSVFWPLFRLTLIFVIAQIGLIYFQGSFILSNNPALDFLQTQATQSNIIIWGWIEFAAAQILLYTLFILALWWLTRASAYFLSLQWSATRLLALVLFTFAIVFLLAANLYYYPNSIFSFFPAALGPKFGYLLSPRNVHTIMFVCGAFISIVTLMAIFGSIVWLFRHRTILSTLLLFAFAGAGYMLYLHEQKQTTTAIIKSKKPNVIIIGVDSLMPRTLTYFGAKQENMPTIDDWLKGATVFTHSLTPLARTSPAWASILTGDNPKLTNARYNLTDPKQLTITETIGHQLQKQGYYTIFATDDRQFNQVNEQFGFTKVIGVKQGLNNFLLSQVNDFPLSNLIINTSIGAWLFPYNYANRASAFSYYPQTFNDQLNKQITQLPQGQPLFMAVHFAMPHWPYYDASMPVKNIGNHPQLSSEQLYLQSLKIADTQVKSFLTSLKKQGLLDNTVVIMLSDHGNTFADVGDRITQQKNYLPNPALAPFRFYTKNLAYGHGVDVLTLPQNHTLLAVKYYNGQKQFVGRKKSIVSLIDITPTILDFLHIQSPYNMQGKSLLPLINTKQEFTTSRSLFLESGFSLPTILSATPKAEEVLDQGIKYYQVIPATGMVTVNPIYRDFIITGKNRAIINAPWMLAYYPNSDGPASLVLVNIKTRQWTTDMHSEFAKSSPVIALAMQLKRFYGDEINLPNLGHY